ncbi:MAG: hypothetical protein AAGA22_01105 [Pseudomonadota bacterium]
MEKRQYKYDRLIVIGDKIIYWLPIYAAAGLLLAAVIWGFVNIEGSGP